MRKKDDNLREIILNLAVKTIADGGTDAINMRDLAKQAGISVGTVYNYFKGKDDILLSITEDYWKDTLIKMGRVIDQGSFTEQLAEIYSFLKNQVYGSAGELMNSLNGAEVAGSEKMKQMHLKLEETLLNYLSSDENVKSSAWSTKLQKEQFVKFVVNNIIMLLRSNAQDITTLNEIVKRVIY